MVCVLPSSRKLRRIYSFLTNTYKYSHKLKIIVNYLQFPYLWHIKYRGANGMAERYIAFDVETPNSRNDRMSAIGIAVVEEGKVTETFYSLVNPETYFNRFNINLTGITPEAAAGAPNFAELWEKISPVMESGLLIAHNAAFDLRVLSKCLSAYGIHWRNTVEYACTVRMGRRCCPQLQNHRLDTLCGYYQIPLNHHEADSDSRACAELLLRYIDAGLPVSSFRSVYRLCDD